MNVITDPRQPFDSGEQGEVSGFRYRVERGKKKQGDLVLLLWNGDRWVKVGMELGGFLADFHFQVEEHLYPRSAGYKGGEKFFQHMRLAVKSGWRFAAQIIRSERTLKDFTSPQTQIFDWEREEIFSDGGA